jgi:hypothetical protein
MGKKIILHLASKIREYHIKDLNADGKIILRLVSKYVVKYGLNWHTMTDGFIYDHSNENCRFV